MFTRKRFVLPKLTKDWTKDGDVVLKAIADYLISLEKPESLELTELVKLDVTGGATIDGDTSFGGEVGTLADWTPTDGSGAGLSLTINSAKIRSIGPLRIGHLDVTYPATADGTSAIIDGLPTAGAYTGAFALKTVGAGSAVLAVLSGTTLAPLAAGAAAVTNANLSGAQVIVSFFYET